MTALVGIAMIAGGCAKAGPNGTAGGRLVVSGEMGDVSVRVRARPDETLLIGSIPICPKGSADVEVTGVKGLDSDTTVTGFAVRPNPFLSGGEMVGFARGTLEEAGLKRATRIKLDRSCSDDGSFYELIVEMRAGEVDTHAGGFEVLTASNDLEIRYPTDVCVDLSSPECADAPELPPDDVE